MVGGLNFCRRGGFFLNMPKRFYRTLPHYEARAKAWLGWAMSQHGEILDGAKQMSKAIEDQRQTGVEEDFPVFLEVLAGLRVKLGELEGALSLCDEALELANQSGMRHWLAEIHRRRGAILKELGPNRRDVAIDAFSEALRIADEQGALNIETRIIASLVEFPEAQDVLNIDNLTDSITAKLDKSNHGLDYSGLRRRIQKGLV